MSFGFLTESALLPSKSKPIRVDGRSLVDLKAIVYAKEQKATLDGGGGGSSSSGNGVRGLRGKRSAAAGEGDGAARKDPFARRNRGVEDRSQRDEVERVTASKKQKAAERTLAAKSVLYDKLAKGEVAASQAGTLVDFARKTGADLALLEAKAGKPQRFLGNENSSATDGTNDTTTTLATATTTTKRRRRASKTGGLGSKETNSDAITELIRSCRSGGGSSGSSSGSGGKGSREASRGGAEVQFTDEFGRERTVPRGGPEHRAHLEAKKAATERRVKAEAEREAYDERYSYRGNRGSAPPLPQPYPNASDSSSFRGRASASGDGYARGGDDEGDGGGSGGGGGDGGGGGWAWSSGAGRGADAGDFETREGQDRRAKKAMAELLEREGASEVGKDDSGAKIRSQWERTLNRDQKAFLQDVHEEAEASRKAPAQKDRAKQRSERKELLRQKQEARAARMRGSAGGSGGGGAAPSHGGQTSSISFRVANHGLAFEVRGKSSLHLWKPSLGASPCNTPHDEETSFFPLHQLPDVFGN
eukprot:jgi/Undpi1/11591/HiC_scaffold_30.g13886.m1